MLKISLPSNLQTNFKTWAHFKALFLKMLKLLGGSDLCLKPPSNFNKHNDEGI